MEEYSGNPSKSTSKPVPDRPRHLRIFEPHSITLRYVPTEPDLQQDEARSLALLGA